MKIFVIIHVQLESGSIGMGHVAQHVTLDLLSLHTMAKMYAYSLVQQGIMFTLMVVVNLLVIQDLIQV